MRNDRIDYVNPAFTESFGYGLEDIVGRHYPKIIATCRLMIATRSLEKFTEFYRRLSAGVSTREQLEIDFVRKDGRDLNGLVSSRLTVTGGEIDSFSCGGPYGCQEDPA